MSNREPGLFDANNIKQCNVSSQFALIVPENLAQQSVRFWKISFAEVPLTVSLTNSGLGIYGCEIAEKDVKLPETFIPINVHGMLIT